jgi:hypothetical protein
MQSARGKNLSASCDFCPGAVDVSTLQGCSATLIAKLLTNDQPTPLNIPEQRRPVRVNLSIKNSIQMQGNLNKLVQNCSILFYSDDHRAVQQRNKGTGYHRTNERGQDFSMQFKGMMAESFSVHFQRPGLHFGSR